MSSSWWFHLMFSLNSCLCIGRGVMTPWKIKILICIKSFWGVSQLTIINISSRSWCLAVHLMISQSNLHPMPANTWPFSSWICVPLLRSCHQAFIVRIVISFSTKGSGSLRRMFNVKGWFPGHKVKLNKYPPLLLWTGFFVVVQETSLKGSI